ncbi:NAD(P)-binding protein [Mycena sanguinolenta]|uniref:NAD(P)-binding protein n=1 Tax=Mycena sanguinolenta TaxID=230812 RepID=A0A8H7DD73_9AGAR|nr:NAD(P)-binding protein [Mycena sanguinolenta]
MGLAISFCTQTFPPPPSFNPSTDIPDLRGKVILITGGYSGIGEATVKELLKHNAKVYIAGRSLDKFEQCVTRLKPETRGREPTFLQVNLGNLASVQRAAEEFLSKETELHVLFNHAGQMLCPVGHVTDDGYDAQFGTNVLGHFFFTKLLLPALIAGAKSSPDGKARVVNTSSFAHYLGSLDFETFKDGQKRRKLHKARLSSQSKLGNVIFSNELARRYGPQGIVSTALNPGHIRTSWRNNIPAWQAASIDLILHEPEYGALTLLWAGTSPETVNYNGNNKFFMPWARLGEAKAGADDEKLGEELWAWLEDQIREISSGTIKAKL